MPDGVTASIDELIELRRFADAATKLPLHARSRTPGTYQSKPKGRGMEFAEVRNYQAGDEIRHMEWRVTARTGRPHVKLYHEERERPVLLITDFNPSMYFGTRVAFKSVLAAKLTALLAWRAIHQGDKVGGLLFSNQQHHEFPPRAHHATLMRLLGQLALYTQSPQASNRPKAKPLSEVLLRVRRVNTPGSFIIFISDFYALNKDCDQHLTHLRQHNDVSMVHVCDPIEQQLPPSGYCPFTNHQDTLLLDGFDPAVTQTYAAYWSQRHLALKQHCQQLGLLYSQITTEQDFTSNLSQIFPWRSHGR
ncbi:MAG: DUF58 domain-containing protein [Gammaproteobacteria bacterium]|nr:DUF58 domain-containing protein [Gammaproteobacteria bacterium]